MTWVNRLGLGPCLWIGVHVPRSWYFFAKCQDLVSKFRSLNGYHARYNSSTTPRTATKGCWSGEMLGGDVV